MVSMFVANGGRIKIVTACMWKIKLGERYKKVPAFKVKK